jgi:hypothetical protein
MMSRRAAYRVTGILAAVFLFLSILPQVFLLQLVVVQRENIDAVSRGSRSLKFTEGKQHLPMASSTMTPLVDTNVENKPICFTTSIFGTSVEAADKPQNVENYFPKFKPSEYDFILFTNLEDMPAPGWTKIVKKDLPYRRFITQSRYGKFVGWREKALSQCGTVIFSDGYVFPQPKLEIFHKVAKRVAESELGLSQVIHRHDKKGIDDIVKSILQRQKDLPENANVTLKWLREQPDFRKYMTYYLGKYFGKFSRRLYRYCSQVLLSLSLLNNDVFSPCSCATQLTLAQYTTRPIRSFERYLVIFGTFIRRRRACGATSYCGVMLSTISMSRLWY